MERERKENKLEKRKKNRGIRYAAMRVEIFVEGGGK